MLARVKRPGSVCGERKRVYDNANHHDVDEEEPDDGEAEAEDGEV